MPRYTNFGSPSKRGCAEIGTKWHSMRLNPTVQGGATRAYLLAIRLGTRSAQGRAEPPDSALRKRGEKRRHFALRHPPGGQSIRSRVAD